MSDFFAEATVTIKPDLTGFVTELRNELKKKVAQVEGTPAARVRIAPALTRDFVGDLRRQINIAVAQAQRGIRPIQVRAVLSDTSRAAISRELRSRSTVGGIPASKTGAGAPAAPVQQSAAAQRLLNTAMAQGIPLLGQQVSNTARLTGARKTLQQQTVKLLPAQQKLRTAQIALAAAQLAPAGSTAQAQQLRLAQSSLLTAQALAQQATSQQAANLAVTQAAPALQGQINALQTTNQQLAANAAALKQQQAALAAASRQQQADASRSARSQAQIRRGVLSTSLSFLGIRGATLAASVSFLAGAAAIAVFAKALQSATDFSTQMSVFRATAGATADELDRVREAARALGADITLPGVSAADAGEAMVELAKAGLDVQDSIDGARGVLQLATAAAIENAQAVELTANALNAFQLAGRDATRVADVFANAANAAQGSIVDIGIAFQQASAAGRQVGLSFEDTSTFLTILARNGLRGSDAGTSLRTALIRLIRPTETAKQKLAELGVEVRDVNGNLRPDIFLQLAEATKELSPAARDAAIALIGGQDAFRAITILGRQSVSDFIQLRKELRQQGTAAELASARAEGLRGSLDALGNTLSTIGLRAGQAFTPALQGVVGGITSAAVAMSESEQTARIFGGSIEFLETVISALGTTLTAVAGPLSVVGGALADATESIGVTNILAAVAAYKLFPVVLARATAATTAFSAATGRAAFALRLLRDPAITGKFSALASSFNLVTVAVAAASAALFFLLTRESAAERVTRNLAEATEGLARARANASSTSRRSQDLGLDASAAELAILEAQQAANTARAALASGKAARGSFERRKLELQLAVALDNVSVAQENYNRVLEDTIAARLEADNAADQARQKNAALIDSLQDLARFQQQSITAGQRFADPGRAREVEERAIRRTTDALRDQARAAREEGSAQSIAIAQRLELLANLTVAVNRVPTQRSISIAINAQNVRQAMAQLLTEFDITSKLAREKILGILDGSTVRQLIFNFQDNFLALFPPFASEMNNLGVLGGDAFGRGVANGIRAAQPEVDAAVDNMIAQTRGKLQGLERQALDISIAGGSDAEVLANLRAQEAAQRQIVAEQEARLKRGEVAHETVRREKETLDRIIQQRRSLEEQMAADTRAAAEESKRRRDEIDDNFLEMLGRGRESRRERITAAQATESLRDDIRRVREARQAAIRQIALVRENVKNIRKQREAIRELKAEIRALARERDDLIRQQRQNIIDRQAERNSLDIEFASIIGNERLEIRAREREIRRLKRLQRLAKNDIIERKRLRNLIAEQQEAIEELRKQEKEKNKSFARLAFEFLQAQQGFAANLLGNIIPGGVTGLVGNVSTTPLGGSGGPIIGTSGPGVGPAAAAGFGGVLAQTMIRDASSAGPTRGQATVELDLLRQILQVLTDIRSGNSHPESRQQRGRGSAAFDTVPM